MLESQREEGEERAFWRFIIIIVRSNFRTSAGRRHANTHVESCQGIDIAVERLVEMVDEGLGYILGGHGGRVFFFFFVTFFFAP